MAVLGTIARWRANRPLEGDGSDSFKPGQRLPICPTCGGALAPRQRRCSSCGSRIVLGIVARKAIALTLMGALAGGAIGATVAVNLAGGAAAAGPGGGGVAAALVATVDPTPAPAQPAASAASGAPGGAATQPSSQPAATKAPAAPAAPAPGRLGAPPARHPQRPAPGRAVEPRWPPSVRGIRRRARRGGPADRRRRVVGPCARPASPGLEGEHPDRRRPRDLLHAARHGCVDDGQHDQRIGEPGDRARYAQRPRPAHRPRIQGEGDTQDGDCRAVIAARAARRGRGPVPTARPVPAPPRPPAHSRSARRSRVPSPPGPRPSR